MTRTTLAASTLIALALAPLSFAAGLTPTEQSLTKTIDAREPDALALFEKVVNINSGTMNFEGVHAVGAAFEAPLHALGFTTQWTDGSSFDRAGHLVAHRPGTGKKILLIGHLDTVFEKDSPFQRYDRYDNNHARGPGTADMKGGIVVALLAMQALQAANALDKLDITFVLNGDEESAGKPLEKSRKALFDAARDRDVAIGLENAADDPHTAVSARRSSSSWELRVIGKSSHTSRIFSDEVGFGAAYEIARVIDGWRSSLAGERFLTFSPGLIAAGNVVNFDNAAGHADASGKGNITAQTAIASGDLRALTPTQRDQAKRRMIGIAKHSLARTHSELTFTDSYPPMSPSVGNSKLLQLYSQASVDLGQGEVTDVDPARAGAADISFVANQIGMAIDGVGLLGGNAHTTDEFADLRNLRSQSQRLAVLLMRLSGEVGMAPN
jgi:glutamate carboxypeptidase